MRVSQDWRSARPRSEAVLCRHQEARQEQTVHPSRAACCSSLPLWAHTQSRGLFKPQLRAQRRKPWPGTSAAAEEQSRGPWGMPQLESRLRAQPFCSPTLAVALKPSRQPGWHMESDSIPLEAVTGAKGVCRGTWGALSWRARPVTVAWPHPPMLAFCSMPLRLAWGDSTRNCSGGFLAGSLPVSS